MRARLRKSLAVLQRAWLEVGLLITALVGLVLLLTGPSAPVVEQQPDTRRVQLRVGELASGPVSVRPRERADLVIVYESEEAGKKVTQVSRYADMPVVQFLAADGHPIERIGKTSDAVVLAVREVDFDPMLKELATKKAVYLLPRSPSERRVTPSALSLHHPGNGGWWRE